MAVPNVSEIVTTTIQSRSKKLADNVAKNNALLATLQAGGRIKKVSGGDVILQELFFAENSTVKNYSGYEQLDITPSEVISAASFDWKQKAVAVTISGLDQLKNSGKERMIDLLEARIENAETSIENSVAVDLYSDGTGDGGKQIGGLQLLVADTPTNTVGGIDRNAAIGTFFRNITFDATTDGGVAATSANIQSYMNRVYVQLVRGRDKPDIIISDNNYFRLFWESLQANQRFTDPNGKLATLGFETIRYGQSEVVLDGGFGGGCPVNHMYFLNSKYIFFRPHSDRNFVPLGGERFAVNQDAIVKLIVWAGNMTMSNGRLQGVLKD
jgi:hypothetical protein